MELIEMKKGGRNDEKGTYVHPELAIDFARWLSPEFAVKVSRLVNRFRMGDLSLISAIVQRSDIINNTSSTVVVNTVSNELKRKQEELAIRKLEFHGLTNYFREGRL